MISIPFVSVRFGVSVLNLSLDSIPHRFLSALFISSPAAFLTQTVCLDDTTVKFEIWDTAGQERYHSLAPMYYRGAQAAIVVYDITNTVSYAWYANSNKEVPEFPSRVDEFLL